MGNYTAVAEAVRVADKKLDLLRKVLLKQAGASGPKKRRVVVASGKRVKVAVGRKKP